MIIQVGKLIFGSALETTINVKRIFKSDNIQIAHDKQFQTADVLNLTALEVALSIVANLTPVFSS